VPGSTLPTPDSTEQNRITLLYHYCRLQLPGLPIHRDQFRDQLNRTFGLYLKKSEVTVSWANYLDGLYPLDWHVAIGCLLGQEMAWDMLFSARTGRSDCLLVDALRARAGRLYHRDEERQESAVTEFWSQLIVSENDTSLPVLARYDGQRPLAPWLIRVFQNLHLSKLRQQVGTTSLPDDDLAMPMPSMQRTETHWHDSFCLAARDWLQELSESEQLILGLRWRYRMSQREVANLLGVHEGTISRQTDKLRDHALEVIGKRLIRDGWTGDDLEGYILTEMGSLLVDEPRLSAQELGRLLSLRGKSIPNE
jgi:RNA polymerase sigma factor (sigma-70 family)